MVRQDVQWPCHWPVRACVVSDQHNHQHALEFQAGIPLNAPSHGHSPHFLGHPVTTAACKTPDGLMPDLARSKAMHWTVPGHLHAAYAFFSRCYGPGTSGFWPSTQVALPAVLPVTQLHVCRFILVPGQGCCHFSFMLSCLGPLRFLPHSPPSPGLLVQLVLHVQYYRVPLHFECNGVIMRALLAEHFLPVADTLKTTSPVRS